MPTFIRFFFFLFGIVAFSQTPVDSLTKVLSESKNDLDKARLLNEIANEYRGSDPSKTLAYGQQALQLSQKIKFKLEEGNAWLNIGNANIIKGNYPEALNSFTNAQSVFESALETGSDKTLELKNGLARALGSIGIVFSEQSSYAKALSHHLKAVKIYEGLNNQDKAARVYNNIGIVYQAQGDSFRALEYFVKSLKIQDKIGDDTAGITLTNIGNIYLSQNNLPQALNHYNRALAFFAKHPDARGLGELYNNFGRYYKASGDLTKAENSFNQALKSFESIGDKFGASDTYAFLGEIKLAQKNYPSALSFTEKSLQLGRELGVMERVRDSERMLSELFAKLNQPEKALEHFKAYSIAKDSIGSYENVRNSIRAEMNFEFDKKQALQKKEQEKREVVYSEQAKRHKLQIAFVTLAVLLLAGISFLIYSRRQLRKNLTLQKELAEYEQKALHLQMNPHFVFNCLGSISAFIVQNGTDSAIKYLSKFSKLMRLTLEYSKESLIPIDREIEGLQNYLELEQLRFNNVFTFDISKSVEIEDDMALPPLLLQPFVENAIIHGLIPRKENGHISVGFELQEKLLICTITDDGIGIDKSQELKRNLVNVHKSMALDITRKRLEMMEAFTDKTAQVDIQELKTDDGTPAGTRVVLRLPIQYIIN